jgi:hypothetical protein
MNGMAGLAAGAPAGGAGRGAGGGAGTVAATGTVGGATRGAARGGVATAAADWRDGSTVAAYAEAGGAGALGGIAGT